MSLTQNSVQTLVQSGSTAASDTNFNPLMQVINVKQVGGSRYRTILSDGAYFVQGMLATQINHLIEENVIRENCIIKVKEFLINIIHDKTVVILLNVEAVDHPMGKIGNPKDSSELAKGVGNAGGNTSQGMYGSTNNNTRAAPPMMRNPNNPYSGGGPSSSSSSQQHASQPQAANRYGSSGAGSYNNNPVSRSTESNGMPITPISQLNMYQNKWTIKARVTTKGEVRTWSNAKGEGSLFGIELLDNSGHDIRATFFKEAVDRFYPMLQQNKIYTFSGGRLKSANMQYNTCKSGFEVTFDANAEIAEAQEDISIQKGVYNFVKVAAIETIDPNTNVDVLCVVKNVGPVTTIMSKKSGQELFKSDLTLADNSNTEITMTLWGEKAKTAMNDYANCPIVAFKNARVSDFSGRCLNASFNGVTLINPAIPEAAEIQQWWSQNAGNANLSFRSLTSSMAGGMGGMNDSFDSRSDIFKIKGESLGYQEKPDYITVKGYLTFVKKDKEGGPWYTACPETKAKITPTADGKFHCDRCQKTYDNCVHRFIFSATFADDSSTTWVSIFDDQARLLLDNKITADEMQAQCFGDNYDTDAFDSYFAKISYTPWLCKLKIKQEMVNEESRIKASVAGFAQIDYVKESKDMLAALSKF